MHTCPDCLPCILKQVNNVAREASANPVQLYFLNPLPFTGRGKGEG
jgi:hypothetical protein